MGESTGESEEAQSPEEERAAKKQRAIVRRVLFFVAPMIPTLIIPWKIGFGWEMNERTDTTAFVSVPLIALAATVVALMKKRSLLVRSLILGGLGVALLVIADDFLTAPRVIREYDRDIQNLDAYALYVGLGVPLLALTMELFAALDRRSRPRALLAGAGWATLVLAFFVPMRSDRVESMPFLVMTELVDDAQHTPGKLLLAAPMSIVLLLSIGAATLTILRLIGDAEQREKWRPRSGCLAIGIGVVPAVLCLLGFTLGAIMDEIEWLGTAIDGGLWTLGFWLGMPALLAAGLDGLATTTSLAFGRGEPTHVKRARLGLGMVLGLSVLSCLTPVALNLMPDSRDDDAGELLLEIAHEIVDTSMGAEPDVRFVGGYSEFDLRGSRGALRSAAGQATPELLYATFEMTVTNPREATVLLGIDPDGGLHFVGGSAQIDGYPVWETLRRASEPLADLADRIEEGLTSVTCLPAEAPPALPELDADPSALAGLCSATPTGETIPRRIRDIPFSTANPAAGTGAYRVWVDAGGTTRILEGRLYSHEGRLWIGKATLAGE